MSEEEQRQRQLIVAEARSWVGTPYRANADLKGAGVDCIRLIKRCYVDSGVVPEFDLPHYSPQWALHQTSELLIEGLLKYSHEIEGPPLSGDIAVFQIGKCWGHSSIVIEWPQLVHASPEAECRYVDAHMSWPLARMTPRFFSIWGNPKEVI